MKLNIFPNHLFVILSFIQLLGNVIWEFPEYIFGTLFWPLTCTKLSGFQQNKGVHSALKAQKLTDVYLTQ